jgi:iron-sulfur cluster repair protein YtfE (RIC family)
MIPADILAALSTVEQDHQLVLDKVKGLKDAVGCLMGPGANLHDALERLRDLNRFFSTAFEAHMQEEEVTLFPLLEKDGPEGAAVVRRLQDDHAEIRRRLEEFDKSLYVASGTEDDPQKMVVRDLLAFGWDLWDILDEHARLETDAVRQCLVRFWRGEAPPAP